MDLLTGCVRCAVICALEPLLVYVCFVYLVLLLQLMVLFGIVSVWGCKVCVVDGIDPNGAILIDLLASTYGFVSVFGVVSVFAVAYLVEPF